VPVEGVILETKHGNLTTQSSLRETLAPILNYSFLSLNLNYLTLKGLGFRGHAEVPIDDIARAIGENLLLPK